MVVDEEYMERYRGIMDDIHKIFHEEKLTPFEAFGVLECLKTDYIGTVLDSGVVAQVTDKGIKKTGDVSGGK